ncbi:hypothetical protein HDU91_005246 [Kappamyces sp. JEL0680]|nr:hypothetical protein HDU91_005246 [Kappamyces sp. JEL0680]
MTSGDHGSSLVDSFYKSTNSLLELKNNPRLSDEVWRRPNAQKLDDYKVLLSSPTWTNQVNLKIMAAKYVPSLVSHFETHLEHAINTQLDLCEDDEVKVSFSEAQLDFIVSLSEPQGGSMQLDLLFRKKLDAMLQTPRNSTLEKISGLYDRYLLLFKTGISSLHFVYGLLSQGLQESHFVGTRKEKTAALRIVCDSLGFVTDVASLSGLGTQLEHLFETIVAQQADWRDIEPAALCVLFYRLKTPHATKENTPTFAAALKRAYAVIQQNIEMLSQTSGAGANPKKLAAIQAGLGGARISLVFTKELMKGANHYPVVSLVPSWQTVAKDDGASNSKATTLLQKQIPKDISQKKQPSRPAKPAKVAQRRKPNPLEAAAAVLKPHVPAGKVLKKTLDSKARSTEHRVAVGLAVTKISSEQHRTPLQRKTQSGVSDTLLSRPGLPGEKVFTIANPLAAPRPKSLSQAISDMALVPKRKVQVVGKKTIATRKVQITKHT